MTRHPRFHFRAPGWADAVLVFALAVIAFLPGLFGGFLNWDDDQNFLENPAYRGLGAPQLVWMLSTYHMGHWKPLTWLTHGLDWTLWGMRPMGYKALSLGIHAAAAVAFLFLARRLLALALARPVDGPLRVGALAAALLFALHPLRVEPVAWLSARADLVAGLFAFLTVLAYLRAHARPPSPSVAWLALSVALFALALAGKSMVVTLPVVLLILDVYPLAAARACRRRLERSGRSARVSGKGALSSPYRWWPASSRCGRGSSSAAWSRSRKWAGRSRLLATVYALAFYLGKTVLPRELAPLYDLGAAVARGPWPFLASAAPSSPSPRSPWRAGAAGPPSRRSGSVTSSCCSRSSGLAQNGSQIAADRYAYLACAGWALLAGGGLTWCAAQVAVAGPRRLFARSVLALATAAAVALRELERLADPHLAGVDRASGRARSRSSRARRLAHAGLANALLAEGRVAEAQAHYRAGAGALPQARRGRDGIGLDRRRAGPL